MSRPRYARLPLEVLRDERLSAEEKVLYAEIATNVFQGSVARIGLRLLAERVKVSKSTVHRMVKHLIEVGHIEYKGKAKIRSFYVLSSEVFGQKDRAGVQEVVYKPDGSSRLASIRKEPPGTAEAKRKTA